MGADPAARRARYRYKAVAWSTQWHPSACALVAAGACFSATGRKLGVEGPSWASRQSAASTSAYIRIEANGENRGDSFQADGEAPMGFPSDIHSHSAISWRWYRYRHTHVVAIGTLAHLATQTCTWRRKYPILAIRCQRRVCVCVCVCACACAQCQVNVKPAIAGAAKDSKLGQAGDSCGQVLASNCTMNDCFHLQSILSLLALQSRAGHGRIGAHVPRLLHGLHDMYFGPADCVQCLQRSLYTRLVPCTYV